MKEVEVMKILGKKKYFTHKSISGYLLSMLKIIGSMKPLHRQPRSKLTHKIPFEQKVITQDGEVYEYAFTKSGHVWYLFLYFIKLK